MVPIYGVQQCTFLMNYLLMDRGDEFQIITFVIGFKTANFISQGIISMIVGALQYYLCSNKLQHNCHEKGPGQTKAFWIDMLFFAFQVMSPLTR